jgi:hypothetical protein
MTDETRPGHRSTDRGTDSGPEPDQRRLTVADLCEQMITARQLAPSTAAVARSVCRASIVPFFAERPVATLTPADIRAWLRWLHTDRGLSDSTVRHHFLVLSASCRDAAEAGLLGSSPCAGIGPRKPSPAPRPPAPRARSLGSAVAGTAAGHSRSHTLLSRLADAIQDGAEDLRPLFLAPDAD